LVQFGLPCAQAADKIARQVDRVQRMRGQRRVPLDAAANRPRPDLALVPGRDPQFGRLAHEAKAWPPGCGGQPLDQRAHADAADLLVIAERKMQRRPQGPANRPIDQAEAGSQKPLHVRGTAAIGSLVAHDEAERVAAPGLALDRHDIGVAGQHDPGHVGRSDRGKQIGLAAILAGDQLRGDTPLGKVVLDKGDQVPVGIAADRGEGDERVKNF
jgi:hypothetical protein